MRRPFAPLLQLCLVLGIGVSLASTVHAARATAPMGTTLTVNTTADDNTVNGNCTLREAILAANGNTTVDQCVHDGSSGTDRIQFNLGSGTPSIAVTGSALPDITTPVVINGNTGGSTRVELNGTSAGEGANGLAIMSGGSTIRALVINRFSDNGIMISGGLNTIVGNYIGTDVNGTTDLGNSKNGIFIKQGSSDTIGGTTAEERNIISGNDNNGIEIEGPQTQRVNILGNYIGTDAHGVLSLGNAYRGVVIRDAPYNVVGGTTAARNIISGNGSSGIGISGINGPYNVVQGNFIGINANGDGPLGNGGNGIAIFACSNTTIGGTTPETANVISGNAGNGISIFGSVGNLVQGNHIGTTVSGLANPGNGLNGIFIDSGTGSSSNTIGGVADGAANTIAFNRENGVVVKGANAYRNFLSRNSIFDNGQLGIDLDDNGVTPNDVFPLPPDEDSGPNSLQNFPNLTLAVSNETNTTVNGNLQSVPNTLFRIEFFASPVSDSTLYGEGKAFIGALDIITDNDGYAAFSTNTLAGGFERQFITATATRRNTNDPVYPPGLFIETSEFSRAILALGSAKPAVWRAGTWFLRNSLTSGLADSVFLYGLNTDRPLMCDWDGDGDKTAGVFRQGVWFLRNDNSSGIADLAFGYGAPGDTPICGDWDGDGVETVGVVRGTTWYVRNTNDNGFADAVFSYGQVGDTPVVGDWDSDGRDTPGVMRGGVWFLRHSLSGGVADIVFLFGLGGVERAIVGDWDADGIDTVSVVRGNTWLLRNSNTSGIADMGFQYGVAGDMPLVWR